MQQKIGRQLKLVQLYRYLFSIDPCEESQADLAAAEAELRAMRDQEREQARQRRVLEAQGAEERRQVAALLARRGRGSGSGSIMNTRVAEDAV